MLRLEKLPMELLILLLERHGDLVSREEIAERLWGKEVFVDVEHSINTAVRKVRQVLHDDPEKPRFLETVVGKGYRFAAPLTVAQDRDGGQPPAGAEVPVQTTTRPEGRTTAQFGARGLLVIAGLVLMALAGAAFLFNGHRSSRKSGQPAITSIVVLPLKNLSGDPEQEYFADGVTEELIGRLANIRGLRVISRTSAMRFKDTRQHIPEIARALNVDAVLEGSVTREQDRVRVNAQLIRGASDEHIWAAEYERSSRDIIALQDELATAIAQHIQITLTPREQAGLGASTPIDPDAHENYLKGRYYLNQRTEDGLTKSIGYFQRAIGKETNYAEAYCGLADAYSLLGFRGRFSSQQSLWRAKTAAEKALALNPDLAEAHASLGFLAETHEWDWATAEREYKRALELDPGDARTHNWFAGYLTYRGRLEEAIAEAKHARELDPLSLPINNALAGRLLVAGRYDEALNQVRQTLDLDPHFAPAHQTLGWAYLNRGKQQDAIQEFEQALDLSGKEDADFLLDLGFAYATARKTMAARQILAQLMKLHQRGIAPPGYIGILYGAIGKRDEAFVWLDKAYEERDPELIYLKVPNRRFEPLRRDPRFAALLRRVGLPE